MTGRCRLIGICLVIAAFVMTATALMARRPGPGEVATRRCQDTLSMLHGAFEKLSQTQIETLTGRPDGVQPVDARVLNFLMACDPDPDNNELFDLVLDMESGVSKCSYYLIFNFAKPFDDNTFAVCDNSHGFQRDLRLNFEATAGPRSRFKDLCDKFEVAGFYATYAAEFAEETEEGKKFKAALANKNDFLELLTKYWWVLLVIAFFDFYFSDLKYIRHKGEGLKFYCFGLYLVCMVAILSYSTIYYTGTPVPDLRDFGHLPAGTYPRELHTLSDVILFTSFGWWLFSIVTTGISGFERSHKLLALLYVVLGPLTFALSESPFGGIQKLAFPIFGSVMALIDVFVIRSMAPEKSEDRSEGSRKPDLNSEAQSSRFYD